jgi:hypothetical protein
MYYCDNYPNDLRKIEPGFSWLGFIGDSSLAMLM